VEQAILEGRVLTLDYVDANGTATDRTVEPLVVIGDPPLWYLWGWCRLREAPRAFKIDRIRGAVMHEEFVPDRDSVIDAYFPVARERSILDDV